MKYLKGVALLVLALLAGCAHNDRTYPVSSGSSCTQQEMLKATDLKKVFKDIALDICVDSCLDCPKGATGSKSSRCRHFIRERCDCTNQGAT